MAIEVTEKGFRVNIQLKIAGESGGSGMIVGSVAFNVAAGNVNVAKKAF
jgi:hypothetical protein